MVPGRRLARAAVGRVWRPHEAFADEVRSAGLGFGLWMEPERFGPGVPIRKEHPEWFFPREATFARIDLTRPDAREYLKREICRLVETYQLAWMKIDFKFELGRDAVGGRTVGLLRGVVPAAG